MNRTSLSGPLRHVSAALVLSGVSLAGPVFGAQPQGFPTAQILDHDSGFTATDPSSVVVDREGRIWVSSDLGGLFVGDGIRFFKVELPQALAGRSITSAAADLLGRIWVLSAGGLGVWDRGTWQVDQQIRQHERLTNPRTDRIIGHPSGALVVVASGRAYRVALGGNPKPMSLPGIDADGVAGLAWAGDRLVVNRGGRFWGEDTGGWAPLPSISLGRSERLLGTVRADGAGHLYLLTSGALHWLAPGAAVWQVLSDVRPSDGNRITSLEDGRIWILQTGRAARGFEGHITWQPIPQDVATYGATAQCVDPESNLWISSSTLLRMPTMGLVRTHVGAGYPPKTIVWRVLRDRSDALWTATEAGVYRQSEEEWLKVPGVESVHEIDVGPDGWLYVNDRRRRLLRVDTKTLRREPVDVPLIHEDAGIRRGPVIHAGRLWVLDDRNELAVGVWRDGRWIWAWDRLPIGGGSAVVDLMADDLGRPWVILPDRALCWFGERWEQMLIPGGGGLTGLSFRSPQEGVASQYDPPRVVAVQRTSSGWSVRPLFGPEVLRGVGVLFGIRQDPTGTMWLGSDRGLIRVDSGGPSRIRQFGGDLGLPSENVSQGALLVEGTERVWVGTSLGLAELRVGEMTALSPMVVPSVLEVRNGSWASPGPGPVFTTDYGSGSVVWELGFAGPTRGHGARFEFRTGAGLWTTLSGNALQFPDISPGRHIYEVRAVPSLGPPGPSRTLTTYVRPPWYRQDVAYGVWSLLAIGFVVLGVRWRTSVLQRRNRELDLAVDHATTELRHHRENLETLVAERTAELKQTMTALQIKNLVFDESLAANSVADLNGVITEVNDAFLWTWGYPIKGDVVGRPISQFFNDQNEASALIRVLDDTGQWEGDFSAKRKDDSVFIAHGLATVVRDAAGVRVGYQSAVIDITARTRAELSARERMKELKALFHLSEISARPGILPDEVCQRLVEVLPESWQYPESTCARIVIGSREFGTKNFAESPWMMSAPISVSGSVAGRIDIGYTDKKVEADEGAFLKEERLLLDDLANRLGLIIEFHRSEDTKAKLGAQLQQAQKMESVGRLAGGVAHDFNNMLGVILGHVELALDRVDPAQPLHDDLEVIRKAALRSADLTRQLLAFARKQIVAPKVLDLNEAVAGMIKLLRRLIGEDIDLQWRPRADLWPVKMDPSQIDQILANLCVNARDAIGGVGQITIETGHCAFSEADGAGDVGLSAGDFVLLAVSDDGCGMDSDTISHLFEPFFTTKPVGHGTGLGLATVYGIVTQNNGSVRVYSEPGQGTTFRIYLPRHTAGGEQVTGTAATMPAARGHETILLVEDEVAILALAARMLVRQGYTVIPAGSPAEAIRLAEEHAGTIDLLLTDVVMPGMNGRDLAGHLQSTHPHLKQLFMSGYTADVIAIRGVLNEAVHFIQKPFSLDTLAAKVREALAPHS